MKILAVDGGTYHTGYAVFKDKELLQADVISSNEKMCVWSFQRIDKIIWDLETVLMVNQPDVLVWESWHGPRNPELQVLLRCLRQLAKMYKCEPVEIHSSSVVKAISLDGKGRQLREDRKLAIREGVAYHYPEYGSVDGKDTQQDVQDSIAIGHTYVYQTR